eukprot:CAMPEP_0172722114 /NCGR_PEP_ID=MMETSP1074-20121228/80698_1 /TAXON_ID=2916 /ORGANISM="Ceratium fusus, Strain PA161109" /LENGTH=41 /DNA_ID= /DNA_START= /DNA_END= /DNA_ORIENTATION=
MATIANLAKLALASDVGKKLCGILLKSSRTADAKVVGAPVW